LGDEVAFAGQGVFIGGGGEFVAAGLAVGEEGADFGVLHGVLEGAEGGGGGEGGAECKGGGVGGHGG